MNWHYTIGGQTYGPITEGELDTMVQSGTLGADTLVWRDGMANWEPYNTVRAPAAAAAAAPPASGLRVAGAAPQSSAEAAAAAQADAACSECGTVMPRGNLVQIGSNLICAQCKPRYVQKLREGVDSGRGGAMNYAGFWIRLGAVIVDSIIVNIFSFLLGLAVGVTMGQSAAKDQASMVAGALGAILALAYDIVMVGTWGGTLGKMACGLRIVTAEGYKVSYLRATGRYFSKILSGLACAIGFIMAAFDEEKRALHDRICSTRVVRR